MVILHEIDPCTKHDLVRLNRDIVADRLESIVNLLRNSLEKRYFSTLPRERIEQFWRDVSNNIQIAYGDFLHLPRC